MDHADLISLLLNNRQKIVYTLRWRQAQEAEKEALEREILNDATINGAALLRALEGNYTKSAKDVLARAGHNRPKAQPEKEEEAQLLEEERRGLSMEATVPKPRAHINLADLEFAAGNHLMSKKTFKLPEGTHKILKPGWEEVHVPAAANKYSEQPPPGGGGGDAGVVPQGLRGRVEAEPGAEPRVRVRDAVVGAVWGE